MKTLVLFYSYSGHTRKAATSYAEKESADISEIKDERRPGMLKAYSAGCFAALRGKAWPIQRLDVDMAVYQRIHLLAPVWAGNPPPAFNAILEQVPEGKSISVVMVSASGKSNCQERITALIKAHGSTLESFTDIQS